MLRREGQSISVPHTLVKRLTEHVTEIPGLGVDTVLGVNGVLWFGPKRAAGDETPATKARLVRVGVLDSDKWVAEVLLTLGRPVCGNAGGEGDGGSVLCGGAGVGQVRRDD